MTSTERPERKEGKPKLHLKWLDGIRGSAALYVLFHHIAIHRLGNAGSRPLWLKLFGGGHYAVDVFIVLSGFCLMIPVAKKGLAYSFGAKEFFLGRATRILPTYYVALLLSIILDKTLLSTHTDTLWDSSLPVTGRDIAEHMLLVQDVFGRSMSINSVMWSIAVEWQIYFLFPLLLWLLVRFNLWWVGLLGIIIANLLQLALFLTPLNSSAVGISVNYVGLFLIGMCASDLSLGRAKEKPIDLRLWKALLALFGVGCAYGAYKDIAWQVMSLPIGLLAGLLMVYIGRGHSKRIRAFFSWQPLVWVGTFGYSLYLFHNPILQLLWINFVAPLHLPIMRDTFALFLLSPVVVAACYVCYLLFEQPILKLRKGKNAKYIRAMAAGTP